MSTDAACKRGIYPESVSWYTTCMDAYKNFARLYDTFMDDVPYEEWSGYIKNKLIEYGIKDGLVLDLGCGTGNMTELLAQSGYDMIGVDNAEDMLEEAMEKKARSGRDILYLMQDMREFELYGTVRAVISICDSLNYMTEDADLLQVFRLVNNYLDPGGVFLFDMNTLYKYRELLGDHTIAENREEGSFIWENYFDEESAVNEYALTIFTPEEDGRYSKYEEFHYQKAYGLERIRELLEQAGLAFVCAYDAYTQEPVRDDSERMFIIAKEQEKRYE